MSLELSKSEVKTILYVGLFNIHNMNAAGKRVFANAKLLEKLGYRVFLLGVNPDGDSSDSIIDTKSEFEQVETYNFQTNIFVHSRYNFASFNKKFDEFADSFNNNFYAIIYYGSPSLALFVAHLQRYAKKKNISIFADVVDWLNIDTRNPLFNIIKRIDIYLEKAILNKRADGIIAISTFLKQYYSSSVDNIVVIPPLSWEVTEIKPKNNVIPQIMYAGYPFRDNFKSKNKAALKDRLDLAIKYLANIKRQGVQFKFHIFGFTKERYIKGIPEHAEYLDVLSDSVEFYGKADMKIVQEKLRHMDYTLLIRDVNRMTSAGFPTKVSESISLGVPVITTKTSDIALYLKDGETVHFLDIEDEKKAENELMDILCLPKEKREIEKARCIKNNVFLIDNYIETIDTFLSTAEKKHRT